MAEQFLTVEQAASRLRVHPITVRRHLQKGILRGIKQGRLWRVAESALAVPPVAGVKKVKAPATSPLARALAMVEERDARIGPVEPWTLGVDDVVTELKQIREAQTP